MSLPGEARRNDRNCWNCYHAQRLDQQTLICGEGHRDKPITSATAGRRCRCHWTREEADAGIAAALKR